MADEKPVERFGDYEFLDRLAVGGMGELWRVRHVTLGATYVAKRLRPEYLEDEEFLKRFFHEAKLVANLRHPNIVQVFGYDEEQALILMEYVEGMDLDALLRSKWQLEFKEKRIIAEVVADTIGYAHREHDLIHRDIKPSNVLIAMSRPGIPIQASRIKLTDFGIARVLSASQRMTMASGMVMGTVHYMAPEQFEGLADKASDVYSIGILYYRLLAGRVPFDGPTAFVIRDKHVKEIAPAPHEVDPSVPLEDSMIVMKCLEKDPARRFADSADLYEALMSGTVEPSASAHVDLHAATQVLSTARADEPVDVTHATHLVEPTQRLAAGAPGATDVTLAATPGAPAEATQRTIPAARAAAPAAAEPAAPGPPRVAVPGEVTERTLQPPSEVQVEAPPKAKARRRALRLAVPVAIAAAVVLVALLALLAGPRYEIRWNTLRSDPLDTPNGIHVSVTPKAGLGLIRSSPGVITAAEDAPPPWSSWATAYGSVSVTFSDGLFRKFTITCRPGEGQDYVDFGGATFEQLAQTYGVQIQEDLSRVGDYLNAILATEKVAAAHNLGDLRRCLDRVAGLLSRTQDVEFDRQRGVTYHGALNGLLKAADALADSKRDQAEEHFRAAEANIQQIDPGSLEQLPDDFLFRQTLRRAIAELSQRAEKAGRMVDSLEPPTSKQDIAYTVERYGAAGDAVAGHLLFAPGHTAFTAILEKGEEARENLEAAVNALTESVPPPIATARRYLAKLDQLIAHSPPPDTAGALRAAVLNLLDDRLTKALAAEGAPWLEKCFGKEKLGFAELAQAYWQQAHRTRFHAAAEQCRKLAGDRLAAAKPLLAGDERLPEAASLLEDARVCLDALAKAAHASEEDKNAAKAQLSTCSVQLAMCLFRVGPGKGADEAQHLAQVRKLLDRGLDELAGGDPKTTEDGQTLRHILKSREDARGKLAASRRANFATRGEYQGRADTLFAALAAYEQFAKQMSSYADHPCHDAALAPFTSLRTAACQGFTLPNGAAYWLLAKAWDSAEKTEYRDAAGLLALFALAPQQGAGEAASPLKRLLPEEITTKAQKLATVAEAFDETAVPAEAAAPKQRWKRLWDRRLKAKEHLAIELPEVIAAGALPQRYRGQEEQWAAIFTRMRALVKHYSGRLAAEETLRRVETAAAALAAKPSAASPQAVQQHVAALEPFKPGGGLKAIEDHGSRLASLERQLADLRGKLVDVGELVAKLLAKPDPKGALDELKARAGLLDKATELRLTRQAVAAWMTLALAHMDEGKFDSAAAQLQAIPQHAQLQKHAQDDTVKAALADATKAAHYVEGQRALAQGAKGFPAALKSFQEAGDYRDARNTLRQLQSLQDAAKHKATAPFQALAALKELGEDRAITPTVRKAAETMSREVEAALVAQAAACTKAFNAALATGQWSRYCEKEAILPAEVKKLNTFLEQVERLEIAQAEKPERTELLPGTRRVKLVVKRVLKFHYKLPDGATLPMTVEQAIEWTVRFDPEEFEDARWLITNWGEAR